MTQRPVSSLSPLSRMAFTMLELLVVISIMAILGAMILVGAKAILGNAERKKTDTIIQTVKTGIELAIANKGSAISPTEHPFAGSRAPRFPFTRTRKNYSGSVSTSGIALRGVPTPDYIGGSDANKLLMTDDRYADKRVVLLFGAKREDIGVLQALRKVVTSYRLLPMPPKSATLKRVIDPTTNSPATSYSDTNFPDTMIPSTIPATGTPPSQERDPAYGKLADSKPALDYLFGNSSAQSELASLKAIFNADPTLPEDQNDFRTPVEVRSGIGGVTTEPLVFTNLGTGKEKEFSKSESQWKPGYIPVSASGSARSLEPATSGTWARYRLPGLAVYDAWGNELMTVTGSNNSYRVISAGQDGALAVNPDKDKSVETNITLDTDNNLQIDSKDKDGAKDNLQ